MDDDVARQLAAAQLRRAELENQKLTRELARLDSPAPWTQKLFQFLPVVTALVSVAGFLWGVKLYLDTQAKEAGNRAAQAERESANAEREFMKPWLESQRKVYEDALNAATAALLASDPKVRASAHDTFWQLFYGRMVLVETRTVSGAMKVAGACIDAAAKCDERASHEALLALGSSMAASMASTAKLTYTEFADKQFKY